MNTLEMRNLGVQELDSKEMVEVDGGALPAWWVAVGIILTATAAIDAVIDFSSGFAEGANAHDPMQKK